MEQFLGLPPVASAHGSELDYLTGIIHWLMLALFIGWGSFYVFTLIRFNRKRHPKADYHGIKSHASSYLEGVVAAVEVVLLVGFSIPLWANRVNDFPNEEDALVVHVVAEQFAWNIHYPGRDGKFGARDIKLVDSENPLGIDRNDPAAKDDITTINQFNVPVNKPVILYLTSKDVIHSFALPYMRVKQDAIPGLKTPVWFTPVKTSLEIREEVVEHYSLAPVSIPVAEAGYRAVVKDYAGRDGSVIAAKGTLLDDEMIAKLTESGVATLDVTPDLMGKVAMMDYNDADGAPLLKKGDLILDDAIIKLQDMGVAHILGALEVPMEIACAQLCGLGHFRMRGYMTVQTQEEYDVWYAEQEAALGLETEEPAISENTDAPAEGATDSHSTETTETEGDAH